MKSWTVSAIDCNCIPVVGLVQVKYQCATVDFRVFRVRHVVLLHVVSELAKENITMTDLMNYRTEMLIQKD